MSDRDLFDPQNKRKVDGMSYQKSQGGFPLTGLKQDALPMCNPYMVDPCIVPSGAGEGAGNVAWIHGNHGKLRPVQTSGTTCVTAECGMMSANIDWDAPISHETAEQMISDLESDILSGVLLLLPMGKVADGVVWVIRPLGNANRAFWVGRIPNEAGYLANQLGFHVLEQTMLGRLSVLADKLIFSEAFHLKFWSIISSSYAQGAKGKAPIFFNAATGTSTGRIFLGSELPVLISNGVQREYWAVWLPKGMQGR